MIYYNTNICSNEAWHVFAFSLKTDGKANAPRKSTDMVKMAVIQIDPGRTDTADGTYQAPPYP